MTGVALLFVESFDSGDLTRYASGTYTRSTTSPRFSGVACGDNINPTRRLASAVTEIYVGCAFYFGGSSSIGNIQLYGDTGATLHLAIFRNASGLLEVRRGGTGGTLLGTGTTTLVASTWYHLQVRATIATSGGICQVRLNGASSNEIDVSGNTKNGGTNSSIDAVYTSTYTTGYRAADWYISDTSGSLNTSWLGDCRAVSLLPTGNGNTSDGANSAGNSTSNYSYVDDAPFASADYVGVTTTGAGDTYAMADVPAATSSVKGIQTTLFAAKSDAGTKSIKPRIRSGGTTYVGSATALGTSYTSIQEIRETDPATSAAWTASGVNAIEAGFEAA